VIGNGVFSCFESDKVEQFGLIFRYDMDIEVTPRVRLPEMGHLVS